VNRDLARILFMIQVGDAAPSDSAQAAVDESCQALDKNLADWRKLNGESLPSVNALLGKYNLQPLPMAPGANAAAPPACKD
jgi:hypothetical protein